MRSEPDAVFKALADPTRRAILEDLIHNGEQTVRDLTDEAGVSQPAVSKHLAVLKSAGLVSERAAGRCVHYSVVPGGFAPLFDWMTFHAKFWVERFDRLENFLKRMDT